MICPICLKTIDMDKGDQIFYGPDSGYKEIHLGCYKSSINTLEERIKTMELKYNNLVDVIDKIRETLSFAGYSQKEDKV